MSDIEAKKVCNIVDDVTNIRYKIVYKKSLKRYEIYTQYKDEAGKFRRNRILYKEAIAVEHDLQKTIDYVNNVLVANHINIYEDSEYMANRVFRKRRRIEPLPDDSPEEDIIRHVQDLDLTDLRTVASMCTNHKVIAVGATTVRYRNRYIAEYAKRKANGVCQLCNMPAPFLDKDGEPYLESHHIEWLSNGGEDSIDNVVALCPNCHKKMHVVNDRNDVRKLQQKIKES